MAKITEEQLEKIVKQNTELEEVVMQVGIVESQKHALLHKIAEVNKVLEEYKAELEEEYGKISIDLKTGEYTEIKEEDALEVVE
mgnify:FL=1|jgi:hypothetical protein|tara:strand:+ start:324 stop:575 length:252 start_codon:yes stop_codon:yes gene_type:complete